MLNGFYIQNAWQMFHNSASRVFIMLENARARSTGGKFETSSLVGEVHEIRALQKGDKGTRKMTMTPEGLQYVDRMDLKIPAKEFRRLGITTILPDMKFYLEASENVYRVVDPNVQPAQDMIKLSCERVRDPLPIFASARVFSADDLGEPPTDWVVVDPSEAPNEYDGVQVAGREDPYELQITSIPAGEVYASWEIQNDIIYPAVKIEFDVILTTADTNGIFGYVGFCDVPGLQSMLLSHTFLFFEYDTGKYYIKSPYEDLSVELQEGTQSHVIIQINRIANTITVTVDEEDAVVLEYDELPYAQHFTAGAPESDAGSGTVGRVNYSGLEVDCLNVI